MFVNAEDIALRLYRKSPHWFKGEPVVVLDGETGSFGFLRFQFPDEIISFRIYIKDKVEILGLAQIAVDEFSEIINVWYKRCW